MTRIGQICVSALNWEIKAVFCSLMLYFKCKCLSGFLAVWRRFLSVFYQLNCVSYFTWMQAAASVDPFHFTFDTLVVSLTLISCCSFFSCCALFSCCCWCFTDKLAGWHPEDWMCRLKIHKVTFEEGNDLSVLKVENWNLWRWCWWWWWWCQELCWKVWWAVGSSLTSRPGF